MSQNLVTTIIARVEQSPDKRFAIGKQSNTVKSEITDEVCTSLAERGYTVRVFTDNKIGLFVQVWKGRQKDLEKIVSKRPSMVYEAMDLFTFVTKALQHRDKVTLMLKDGQTKEDVKDVDPDSIITFFHRDSLTTEIRERLARAGLTIFYNLYGAKVATVVKGKVLDTTVNLYRMLNSLNAMDLSTLGIIMAIIGRDMADHLPYTLVSKDVGLPNPHIIEFLCFKGFALLTATCVDEHIQMVIFHDGRFQDLKPFGSCEYVCSRPCQIPPESK